MAKKIKYLCLADTHGFKGRYWTRDEIYEFDEEVKPDKRYFELITKNTVLPMEADIDKPMNTLADAVARPYKKEPTAGEVLANQKSLINGDDKGPGDIFAGKRHPAEVPLSDRDKALINAPGNDL
jgi:hypothetical protein